MNWGSTTLTGLKVHRIGNTSVKTCNTILVEVNKFVMTTYHQDLKDKRMRLWKACFLEWLA